MVDTTTSKLGADMTDEQIAEFGYAHSDEHDEPLFAFDRAGFIACVHAILARQPAAIDKQDAVEVHERNTDDGKPFYVLKPNQIQVMHTIATADNAATILHGLLDSFVEVAAGFPQAKIDEVLARQARIYLPNDAVPPAQTALTKE